MQVLNVLVDLMSSKGGKSFTTTTVSPFFSVFLGLNQWIIWTEVPNVVSK